MPALLALPALGDGDDPSPVVISGTAGIRQKQVEPAGQAFFEAIERGACGTGGKTESRESEKKANPVEPEAETSPKKKKNQKKPQEDALKLPELLKGEDLYGLLECEASVSQGDLRKAHRQLCLIHHPDKQGVDVSDEDKEVLNVKFLKLQAAFDVLSDEKLRRKYDSQGDFDNDVPVFQDNLGRKPNGDKDFFEVFGPVFKRNAVWSEQKPVPDLGDENTPYETVKDFYNFWHSFQSWRDLDALIMEECGEDCFHDFNDAECREEKRWMERENTKLRGEYLKGERRRIELIVKNAEKFDPRLLAEKERKRQAREAQQAEKDRVRLELERLAREEEERRLAAGKEEQEQRKAEKAQKDEVRQAKKAARAKLRKLVKDLSLGIDEDQLQDFLLTLQPEEVEDLAMKLEAGAQGEAVFSAMKGKGFEAVIVPAESEASTVAGVEENDQSSNDGEAIEGGSPVPRQQISLGIEKKSQESEEVAALRLAEKQAREAKKKQEQARREQERKKAEKKEQDRLKKEEEKRKREEEKVHREKEEKRERQQAEKALKEGRAVERYIVKTSGSIFASATSWDIIGEVCQGQELVAAGTPSHAGGHTMLPVLPKGAVDMVLLDRYDATAVAPLASPAMPTTRPVQSAAQASAAKHKQQAAAALQEAHESAASQRSRLADAEKALAEAQARVDLLRQDLVACDSVVEVRTRELVEAEDREKQVREDLPKAPCALKQGGTEAEPLNVSPTGDIKKKGTSGAVDEEDLDALLSEFGVNVAELDTSKSKKTKKKTGKK